MEDFSTPQYTERKSGLHPHAATTGHHCWLQTCLGDLQRTKQNTFLLEPHLTEKNPKEETKL
jgi:hypothetical protein